MSGSVKVVTVRSGEAGGAPADRFVVFLFIIEYEIIGEGPQILTNQNRESTV